MFDTSKQISSIHKQGVTWLDLERVENRYLLAGSADCSVAVYDVAQPISGDQQPSEPGDYGSVLKITASNPDCHRYSVSSVAWYPIDTGLFVTGSFDHQVKVAHLSDSCNDRHIGSLSCFLSDGIAPFLLSVTERNTCAAGLGCKSEPGCMQLHIPRQGVRRGNVSSGSHALLDCCRRWRPSCEAV